MISNTREFPHRMQMEIGCEEREAKITSKGYKGYMPKQFP